jgi:general secretion pathway protein D
MLHIGLAVAFCLLSPTHAETPPPASQATFVNFNFDQADVRVLIKLVGDITGRKFVVDPAVEGKVTVVTPGQIPVTEVYQLLLAVLESAGYAVLEQDGVFRVLARAPRPIPTVPVLSDDATPSGDALFTKVISLAHVSAAEVRRMLEPMVADGKNGALTALETTNHIVVTDTADNIRRLEALIAQIDRPGVARVTELYTLKHAVARNIADELNQAITGLRTRADTEGERIRQRLARSEGGGGPADAVVVAAPHSNSLILAGTPAQVAELKDLIARLDVEAQAVSGHLQAIFLKYLSAEDAAKSLTALLARNAEKNAERSIIAIEANLANNALMVDAAPQDFEMVRQLVEKLDLPPPQVLVEVMIAEMTLGDGHDYGAEFLSSASPQQDSTVIVGGSRAAEGEDRLLAQVVQGVVPQGLTFGLAKGSYTDANGNVVPRFPFLMNVNALKYESNFKILSNVPLWAQNNQEAAVTIGKNIPILKSTIEGGSGTARDVIENIDRIDVGIKLKVTPQVNPDGEVCMRLNPSIEAILEATTDGKAFTPTIARREVTTTLTVPSGETIVISGLIREDNVEKERRVPFLGSIPLLGWIFRHSVKEVERTNLLIFVTPSVARTREEAAALTGRWRQQALGELVQPAVSLPPAAPEE